MLKLLYVLLSECAESTLRNFRKLAAKSTPVDPKIMNDLKVDGVSVQEDFLTSQQCDEYIAKIEKIIASGSSNIWKDSAGADNRIYFAETLDDKFAEFFETPKIRQILSRYTGTEKPKGMHFILNSPSWIINAKSSKFRDNDLSIIKTSLSRILCSLNPLPSTRTKKVASRLTTNSWFRSIVGSK